MKDKFSFGRNLVDKLRVEVRLHVLQRPMDFNRRVADYSLAQATHIQCDYYHIDVFESINVQVDAQGKYKPSQDITPRLQGTITHNSNAISQGLKLM